MPWSDPLELFIGEWAIDEETAVVSFLEMSSVMGQSDRGICFHKNLPRRFFWIRGPPSHVRALTLGFYEVLLKYHLPQNVSAINMQLMPEIPHEVLILLGRSVSSRKSSVEI